MRCGENLGPIPADVWSGVGQAAVGIANEEGGLLALAHSPHETVRPIASVSKLVTAMALTKVWQAHESYTLPPEDQTDESYEIRSEDIILTKKYRDLGARTLPLEQIGELGRRKAVESMLVCSASNVADMLVERTFGSMYEYLLYANSMLQDMELGGIVVADATGFSPKTVGLPSELVIMGAAALKRVPAIAEMAAKSKVEIPGRDGFITMDNRSPLRGQNERVIDLKTGSISFAGKCSVFADLNPAQPIVGAITGSDTDNRRSHDSMKLLGWAQQARS